MRILFFAYYYLPHVGAATWCIYSLSKHLTKNGNDVCLVIPRIKHELSITKSASAIVSNENPSRVFVTPRVAIPRLAAPILSVPFLFVKGLRAGKPDVILCQYHPHHFVPLVGILLGKILHVPEVLRADDIQREMGIKIPLYARITNLVNE